MREIKFRVLHEGRMRDLSDIHFCETSGWTKITSYKIESSRSDESFTTFFVEKPNELVIVQYTWLKDKNWKEIYEGDIVEFDWEKEYWEVYFDKGSFWYKLYWKTDKRSIDGQKHPYLAEWLYTEKIDELENIPFRVVWNIYENPDLLD